MYKLTSVCTAGLSNRETTNARLAGVAVDGEFAVHKRADLANGVGHDGRFEKPNHVGRELGGEETRKGKKREGQEESWALGGGRFLFLFLAIQADRFVAGPLKN